MDKVMLQYLNTPFRSTNYKKIGFTIPKIEQKERRSKSIQSKRSVGLTFPILETSFYELKETPKESRVQPKKIKEYLARFMNPENAAKSKLMRDLDYRTQIMKEIKH